MTERATPGVPKRFDGNRQAQAYFGALKDQYPDLDEDDLVERAKCIDQVVREAVQAHSISPTQIEAEIRKRLLPEYFSVGGLDAAQELVEKVIHILRAGAARASV